MDLNLARTMKHLEYLDIQYSDAKYLVYGVPRSQRLEVGVPEKEIMRITLKMNR